MLLRPVELLLKQIYVNPRYEREEQRLNKLRAAKNRHRKLPEAVKVPPPIPHRGRT